MGEGAKMIEVRGKVVAVVEVRGKVASHLSSLTYLQVW